MIYLFWDWCSCTIVNKLDIFLLTLVELSLLLSGGYMFVGSVLSTFVDRPTLGIPNSNLSSLLRPCAAGSISQTIGTTNICPCNAFCFAWSLFRACVLCLRETSLAITARGKGLVSEEKLALGHRDPRLGSHGIRLGL
jgi:hypothetical protein